MMRLTIIAISLFLSVMAYAENYVFSPGTHTVSVIVPQPEIKAEEIATIATTVVEYAAPSLSMTLPKMVIISEKELEKLKKEIQELREWGAINWWRGFGRAVCITAAIHLLSAAYAR